MLDFLTAAALIGAFLWGFTLFLAERLADTRTFSAFVEQKGPWIVDAVFALVEDEETALSAGHHGLRIAAARWPRWAWLPIPEARILKQATAHARSLGHPPKIVVAAFLIDVCGHVPSDVARSLVWPSSSAGIRTGRKRQLIHEVGRTWFGRGPQHWDIDLDVVTSDRVRRTVWWEVRFLAAIIGAIFLGLLIVEQALVGDLFN